MHQLINFFRKNIVPILVLILIIPTFYKMLRPGMFSTQDFHIFRQLEFDKCVKALQIPCRWAPDAGLGYGEPLFNFYGQFTYAVGEVFHLVGFSIVDSVKILFILSLLGSGVSMFFLGKEIWKNDLAALVSAILYVYAPYRAVDVWVRGALPEAFSFILFPLIILSVEKRNIAYFSLLTAILIITHNLSFVMFLPLLVVWIIYRKWWKSIIGLVIAALISSFYILPVVFESKFVDLQSTITGYFDYRAHFVTFYQLFTSRVWGYGGSTWGADDGLSLSIGQIQWVLPTLLFFVFMYRYMKARNKKFIIYHLSFIIFYVMGLFYLFLAHNKSTFLWDLIPPMAYIQFPWRFLGLATFCFALSGGELISLFDKKCSLILAVLVTILSLIFNISFFKEDIWYKVDDSHYITGTEWVRQRTASIGDFWPDFGHKIPDAPSDGKLINYFPGWVGAAPVNGLIPSSGVRFTDTPARRIGNIISLVSFLGFVVFSLKTWKEKV